MSDMTRTDCISRQALLDKTVNKNSIWKSITNSSGENLEEIINGLPSVLPKANKPKEKWILKNVDTSVLKIECPICGFKRNVLKETLSKFNYCPNCGVDMREEKENE